MSEEFREVYRVEESSLARSRSLHWGIYFEDTEINGYEPLERLIAERICGWLNGAYNLGLMQGLLEAKNDWR